MLSINKFLSEDDLSSSNSSDSPTSDKSAGPTKSSISVPTNKATNLQQSKSVDTIKQSIVPGPLKTKFNGIATRVTPVDQNKSDPKEKFIPMKRMPSLLGPSGYQ